VGWTEGWAVGSLGMGMFLCMFEDVDVFEHVAFSEFDIGWRIHSIRYNKYL